MVNLFVNLEHQVVFSKESRVVTFRPLSDCISIDESIESASTNSRVLG